MHFSSEFFVLDGDFDDGASLVIREKSRDGEIIGRVNIEDLSGNLVISVQRLDESKVGPVSLVVV